MRRCFVRRLLCCIAVSLCLVGPAMRGAARTRQASEIRATNFASRFPIFSAVAATLADRYRSIHAFHERYEKAISYSRAGYTLYFVSYFLAALVLLLILRLGVAAKFRDIAESVTDKRWLQGFIFVPLLILTTDVLRLPVSIYWHALSLRYEQSIQRWGSWLLDWLKAEALGVGLALLLALLLNVAMRKSPRRWWFYFWLAALPVLLFFFFISPWFIDPLFNHFEPLANEHPQLVSSIENLTQRAGVPIPANRIFLMRASEKPTR